MAVPAAAWYTERTTEEFGPAPPGLAKSEDKRFALAHLAGRAYWYHKNWMGWSQIHDEARVAGAADNDTIEAILTAFADLPIADKEIRVLPPPRAVRSAKGKTVGCDWQIEWMSHTSLPRGERKTETHTDRAVLTLFVARAGPIGKADGRTAQWIQDLNDARFAARQSAFRALAEQGDAVASALREAVDRNPTAEQRARLDQLLARLKPLHLRRIKMPPAIPVISVDELMKREQAAWRSGDLGKMWYAADHVADCAEHTEEALPILVEMLSDDRVQVRDLANGAFGRLGRRAVSALPAIRLAEQLSSKELGPSFQQALAAIENGPATFGVDETWQQNRSLRQDIATACVGMKEATQSR